LDNGRQEL